MHQMHHLEGTVPRVDAKRGAGDIGRWIRRESNAAMLLNLGIGARIDHEVLESERWKLAFAVLQSYTFCAASQLCGYCMIHSADTLGLKTG